MRIKRVQLTLLAFFALVFSVMPPHTGHALVQWIDTERSASLTIHYLDDKTPLPEVEFRLYRVADVSTFGYTMSGDFAEYTYSFDNMDNEAWTDAAEAMWGFAVSNNLTPTATGETDKNGTVVFSKLTTGLYLVTADKHTTGNYTYTPQAYFVCLPDLIGGTWKYDVTSEAKIGDRTSKSKDKNPGGGGTYNPVYVEREVVKIWNDYNSKDRPDSVVVWLLRDGSFHDEKTLNDANGWRYTWTGLESTYNWTIIEKEIPDGYTVSIRRDGTLFTVINSAPKKDDDPDEPDKPQNDPDKPDKPQNDPDKPDKPQNDPDKPQNDPDKPDKPQNDPDKPQNDPDKPDNPTNNPDTPPENLIEEPGNSDEPTLPQTGMLWWPVPVMYTLGAGVFFAGYRSRRRSVTDECDDEEEG